MKYKSFGELFADTCAAHGLPGMFPEDAVYSLPVPVRRENRVYDALFVYRIDDASVITRPFCWMMLSSDGGPELLLSWCEVVDFISTDTYPLGAALSAELPRALSARAREKLSKEIMEVYEELRLFAFEENLNREQVACIVKYKELFLRLCYSGLYAFYHALSPAFFHWLRLPLPEMKKAHIPKELANTNEYQYQLLILETLQQMAAQFQEKISADAHKQKLFDEMHEELQGYKNGFVEGLALSLQRDVIQLIDSISRSLKALEETEPTEDNYLKLLVLFEGIRTDLQDMLYRQGVDPYETPGDEVSVQRQKILSTIPTGDPALDKKVAARLSPGWEKDGRIIRPEIINAYLHVPEN